MLTRAPLSLPRLLARLSPTLLLDDEELLAEHPVSTFTLYDAADPTPSPPGAIVLGVGVDGKDAVRSLVRLSERASAIVLRESLARDPDIRSVIGERLAVLALREHASWSQLAATLAVVFGLAQETPDSVTFGDAESDLFTLANSVANLVGGPATIEDLSSRILAFSSDQAEADDARMQSVLGHQVPDSYSDVLRERGYFNTLYQSPSPVFIDTLAPGIRPRVAMRLQAGGELLGSVWIVVDGPLSVSRQQGLIEAANIIALTLLRVRMTRDTTIRLRTERVLSLLEGGAPALETAKEVRVPTTGLVVLALGLPMRGEEPDAEYEMQRVAGSLAMHLHSVRPNTPVALLGDVVYAVLPLEGNVDESRAAATVRDFLSRFSATTVYAGVGSSVDVRDLPVSRKTADRVLRVLRHRRHPDSVAATTADILTDSLLLRMSDLLGPGEDIAAGPLRILHEYDGEHGTQLVDTLRVWLDRFGDIASASDALLVHKNTFRYRLRRLRALAGIDLDDPEQRFGLMLQLRLLAL